MLAASVFGFMALRWSHNVGRFAINEAEAETVRTVFRLYLECGNERRVKEEAERLGLITNIRKPENCRMRGGHSLSRGYIYKLLGNPLYIGRIAHKGETYEGQHPAIINRETWDGTSRPATSSASSVMPFSACSPIAPRSPRRRGTPEWPPMAFPVFLMPPPVGREKPSVSSNASISVPGNHDGQTLPRELIDHGEHAESAAHDGRI